MTDVSGNRYYFRGWACRRSDNPETPSWWAVFNPRTGQTLPDQPTLSACARAVRNHYLNRAVEQIDKA